MNEIQGRSAAALAMALLAACTPTAQIQATGPQPASPVRVEFAQPERFTDVAARYSTAGERAHALDQLARYVQRRAAPLLSSGHSLQIVISDLDRAGAFEPWRGEAGYVRIVRDVYPPRIDLQFRWQDANGKLIRSGERRLRDAMFLSGAAARDHDPLRYEKALLDRWLERELAASKQRTAERS